MAQTGLKGMGGKSAVVTDAAKGIVRATAELPLWVQFVRGVVIFFAVLVDALNRRRGGRAA